MDSTQVELEKFRNDWQKEVEEKKRHERRSGEETVSKIARRSSNSECADATESIPSQKTVSVTLISAGEQRPANEETLDEDEDEDLEAEVLDSSMEELVQDVAQMALNSELQLREVTSVPPVREEAARFSQTDKRAPAEVEWTSANEPDGMTKEDPEVSRAQRALKIYELAVEKERDGNLSDALKFYRQAFRLDDSVDKLYKNKHFPSSAFTKRAPSPSKKITTSSLPTDKTTSLLSDYSHLEAEPEDEDLPSPLIKLPNEITNTILRTLAVLDLSSFTKTSYTCRKLAFLAYSDSMLWRSLCMKEYPRMAYEVPVDENEAIHLWNDNWRRMFLERPRILFNGIYISTCNYHRYGVSHSWNVPVHIVTYYRYVRFFDDGTCMTHLTTKEPVEVVPEFHRHLMKRGMFKGTWRMLIDGRVRIESQAPVAKYLFLQELDIKSSGRGRHNRLNWVGFWSINRATADRMEFSLRHDKPFYFSRVLSYDRESKSSFAEAPPSVGAAVHGGGEGVVVV
ncbi:hypothetical protein V1525DRAFT_393169 [Lipomyces kononenkoae]|uniref:Uncharacterized protein n=1 Tax=Lipomyces kononenkoae TaxID=34357 RepID=A0ACC3TBV5_LIPKO